ncbi:MAG: hypothetical protein ACXAEU_20105 [Candidatus Hodarchaeales archaeon]|jgi:hypothetical protein
MFPPRESPFDTFEGIITEKRVLLKNAAKKYAKNVAVLDKNRLAIHVLDTKIIGIDYHLINIGAHVDKTKNITSIPNLFPFKPRSLSMAIEALLEKYGTTALLMFIKLINN